MQHVFGPVSSKRLGQSLGVDLLAMKSCTWNCIYCQLGRTKSYTLERQEFYPKEEILSEIRAAVESGVKIDWITLVGSGETTLYRGIGWLVREVKRFTDIPVAVITNGSLLADDAVRSELLLADAVLPSLSSGSEELFQRINRPAPGFTLLDHLEGLKAFREVYRGRYWVEVMLLGGINDADRALGDIAHALKEIRPDMVHLIIPTRPAPEKEVCLPEESRIEAAIRILSEVAVVVHPRKGSMDLSGAADPLEAVTAIASRHPVQLSELRKALLDLHGGDGSVVDGQLDAMFASGRFRVVLQAGEPYWVRVGA